MKAILLIFITLLPITAFSESSLFRTVDNTVHSAMEKQKLVGVAVGIIEGGNIVYTKGYGYADIDLNIPITENTIINWASNSKPVIATVALQLAENEKLDLDKPIQSYLPHLPDHLKNITTRQLLSHQSGIPHYENGIIIPGDKSKQTQNDLDPLNSLNRFILSPLIFKPGTKMEYSSYAYILLTAVVQAAGDEDIDKQLKQRIIDPLGLNSFQFDTPAHGEKNWSKGYRIKNGQPQEINYVSHAWKHGAGGYKSNIKDFTRFALALINKELLDEEGSKKMWSRQKTSDRKLTTSGLGVFAWGTGQYLKISHNGSQGAVRTRMELYPNQKNGVVVMCNTQSCNPVAICRAIHSALDWKKKERQIRRKFKRSAN